MGKFMGRVSDAREKLIDAATQLIWKRGYNAVGVNELCRKADVKPGSFYYFFPSKRDLVLAALDENWIQTQANVFEPAFANEVPPSQRIAKIFELAYQYQNIKHQRSGRVLGCAFGSLGSELVHQDEAIRNRVEEIFTGFCQYFEQALQDAVEANAVDIDDIPTKARALLAYLEGVLLLARTHNNAEIIPQLTSTALDIAGFKGNAL